MIIFIAETLKLRELTVSTSIDKLYMNCRTDLLRWIVSLCPRLEAMDFIDKSVDGPSPIDSEIPQQLQSILAGQLPEVLISFASYCVFDFITIY